MSDWNELSLPGMDHLYEDYRRVQQLLREVETTSGVKPMQYERVGGSRRAHGKKAGRRGWGYRGGRAKAGSGKSGSF